MIDLSPPAARRLAGRVAPQVLVALAFASCVFTPALSHALASDACVVARIDGGASPLATALRTLPEVDSWVEADRDLLLCATGGRVSALRLATAVERAGGTVRARFPEVAPEHLRFWRGGRPDTAAPLGRILAAGGRWTVLELAPWASDGQTGGPEGELGEPHPGQVAARLFPFTANVVLARRHLPSASESPEALTDPQIGLILGELSATRWYGDIVTLAGWNRWTRGSQILSARDWLAARLGALAGMTVTTASFPVGANTGWNVIGKLVGTARPDDWYVVGGHYDSTSENPSAAAPGAEDNASGCAGVLELARLFAAHPPDASIYFVCFSGEEQGLYGSFDFVDDMIAAGTISRVRGAFVTDMIGFTADLELDCLLETEPVGQTWMNGFLAAAANFTTLSIVTSLNAWGSDHVPFLNANRPALLAIANDWDVYPHYHRTTDLPGQISPAMGLQILRMAAAGLLREVGSTLTFADGFESGGLVRWSGSAPL